jgi:hypothetical protein
MLVTLKLRQGPRLAEALRNLIRRPARPRKFHRFSDLGRPVWPAIGTYMNRGLVTADVGSDEFFSEWRVLMLALRLTIAAADRHEAIGSLRLKAMTNGLREPQVGSGVVVAICCLALIFLAAIMAVVIIIVV